MPLMTRTVVTVLVFSWLGLTVLPAQTSIFQAAPPIAIGGGSGQLSLLDTNGDKHLDLVVHRGRREIVVFIGNGRGQFSPAPGGPIDLLGIQPDSIATGDVVADDQADLVVAFRDTGNE